MENSSLILDLQTEIIVQYEILVAVTVFLHMKVHNVVDLCKALLKRSSEAAAECRKNSTAKRAEEHKLCYGETIPSTSSPLLPIPLQKPLTWVNGNKSVIW